MKVWIDGKLLPKEEAKISVFDHGLLYGDGVFEGIRAYGGCIFRLRQHLERLYGSAHYLMMKVPMTIDEMEAAVVETVRANELRDCYVRLVVTRGPGPLGLLPYQCDPPTVIIIAAQIKLFSPELYDKGARLMSSSTRRIGADMLNARVKSLNYLSNILAKMEAVQAGYDEALMLDNRGFITEGAGDNVFIVKNRVVTTVPSAYGALKGVTRDFVLELADELGYEVREEPFTRYELMEADEAFLTGTAAELIPVRELDGRAIGAGGVGPVTAELIREFRARAPHDGVFVEETVAAKG
jgi:branched-chain amino acid aminotransferase